MNRALIVPTLACLALPATFTAYAADHLDAPATSADPTADINDVYTWVEGDKTILAMTLFPAAGAEAKFSDAVQYVFHTASGAAFGAANSSKDVICTFDAAQRISCWIGSDDYVTGDASDTVGLVSASGKVKAFAGLRDDPFFFNLTGFRETVKIVVGAAAALVFDIAGCPGIDPDTSAALVAQLISDASDLPGSDFFAPLNTLSIVLELDTDLVNDGGPILAVWGATRMAP